MLKKILNLFEKYCVHFLLVYNSPYSQVKDKFNAFIILNVLYIKSKLIPNPKEEITFKIFKYKVSAYSYGTLFYLFKEIFLNNEYYFKSNNPELKIIDCGANIGMSILYFKSIYPDCSIIAFEPNPFAFSLLKKNVEQNNLQGVTLYNTGLSDDNKVVEFFLPKNKGSLTGSLNRDRGGSNTIKIKTEKLSDYLKLDMFDLVKMDVEGGEMIVLNDLRNSKVIKNSRRYIIEYHHKMDRAKSNLSKFILPFENNDFEYNVKTSFGKVGEFQDILINAYKGL